MVGETVRATTSSCCLTMDEEPSAKKPRKEPESHKEFEEKKVREQQALQAYIIDDCDINVDSFEMTGDYCQLAALNL